MDITSPQILVPILASISIAGFVWVAVQVFSRGGARTDERLKKFGDVGAAQEAPEARGTERLKELIDKAAPVLAQPLQPKTAEEKSQKKLWLAHGGYRSENAVQVYLMVQGVFLLIGLVMASSLIASYGFTRNGVSFAAGVAGLMYFLPNFFVSYQVSNRQKGVFLGLPDALDLLVVCVEAGLGLDAAMRKVCEELGHSQPIISEEFSICNFQLQMGRPRRDVLHDLGQRTGVDDMKALAAILIQADRFGSSIAQALRVQSDSMRVRRRQIAEEKAAATAVKILFPLVLFIFPAIFVVMVGPAAIRIEQVLLKK